MKRFMILVLLITTLAACSSAPATTTSEDANAPGEIIPIIEAVKFAKVSMLELEDMLGEPEEVDEWEFKSANGQTYNAITWIYESGNQEFMFIDEEVVRFTLYGTDQLYHSNDHALALFGITQGPNITKVADTGGSLRYERVDVSMKIDDFWLVEGNEKNTIGTVKITYDSRYF